MTSTGTATKNSHESATTAIANTNTANGNRTRATIATNPVMLRSWSRNGGRGVPRGQARRHESGDEQAAQRDERSTASSTKPWPTNAWYTSSQRRSWKMSNGSAAGRLGGERRGAGRPRSATSSASSAHGPAARAISHGWSRRRGRARLARSGSAVSSWSPAVIRARPAWRVVVVRRPRAASVGLTAPAHDLSVGGGPRRAPGRAQCAGRMRVGTRTRRPSVRPVRSAAPTGRGAHWAATASRNPDGPRRATRRSW